MVPVCAYVASTAVGIRDTIHHAHAMYTPLMITVPSTRYYIRLATISAHEKAVSRMPIVTVAIAVLAVVF